MIISENFDFIRRRFGEGAVAHDEANAAEAQLAQ
jgi:hypothetical protein